MMLQKLRKLDSMLSHIIKERLSNAGFNDLSAIQAMVLFEVATLRETSAGKVNYHGTNPHYTTEALRKREYVNATKSMFDARSVILTPTKKGVAAANVLNDINENLTACADAFSSIAQHLKRMNSDGF